jgi:hypothetical protein
VAKVVEHLQEVLDKAKAGEVRAVAIAFVDRGFAKHRFAWDGDEFVGYPMATAVACMSHDYFARKVSQQEPE